MDFKKVNFVIRICKFLLHLSHARPRLYRELAANLRVSVVDLNPQFCTRLSTDIPTFTVPDELTDSWSECIVQSRLTAR